MIWCQTMAPSFPSLINKFAKYSLVVIDDFVYRYAYYHQWYPSVLYFNMASWLSDGCVFMRYYSASIIGNFFLYFERIVASNSLIQSTYVTFLYIDEQHSFVWTIVWHRIDSVIFVVYSNFTYLQFACS